MKRHVLILRAAAIVLACGALAFSYRADVNAAGAISGNLTGPSVQTCFSHQPCVQVIQHGKGNALDGSADQAYGVLGRTRINTGSVGARVAGVAGFDQSSNSFNAGVLGTSTGGFAGVFGRGLVTSAGFGAYGVWGETFAPSATPHAGFGGLVGLDLSTDGNTGDFGAAGVSDNGTGVLGHSFNDVSVEGTPFGRFFLSNGTTNIVTGMIGVGSVGGAFLGLDQSGTLPALFAESGFGSDIMQGANDAGNLVMSLDNSGNMILAGSLTQNGTPTIAQRTSTGSAVTMYGSEQAAPTMETVGEAQLVGGKAYVRLDPKFAGAIDGRTPYLVFVTPSGPSRGLYVANKSAGGFAVLENPGGSSTLAFDYRVVARPIGAVSHARALNAHVAPHFTGSKSTSKSSKSKATPE